MIIAEFFSKTNSLVGFEISGHAEYDDYGLDIVCSAVTSATQMCINTITEVVKTKAEVKTLENKISFAVEENLPQIQPFLLGLKLHLELLEEDYKENIQVKVTEV